MRQIIAIILSMVMRKLRLWDVIQNDLKINFLKNIAFSSNINHNITKKKLQQYNM